ncbi:unnamed protein product [Amoebophrya sp. A25]|nr:unnamed protein product [Amoebophrya sp. A25]|eukprot:GSA25T00014039001.1
MQLEDFPNGLPPETFAAKLHAATKSGDSDEVLNLLQSIGAAPSASSSSECMTKKGPARTNEVPPAGLTLLNYSVDAPDIDLYTPLHRAVESGHVDVCKILLDAGADVNVSHPGLDGWTPLHLACWQNELAIIDLLVQRGADGEARDWYANTARDLGEEATQAHVGRLLDAKKASQAQAGIVRVGATTAIKGQGGGATGTANKMNDGSAAAPVVREDGAEWKAQNLTAPCSMTVSEVQARMIEFSIKHCQENDIGGEWQPK